MRLLTFIFAFIHNLGSAQINMDSLLIELSNPDKFLKSHSVEYLLESFQRFESIQGNELYDVFLDSTGKLSEYISLTAVNRQFDNEGRLIKLIGYSKNGTYSYWDFPPIAEITYLKDTTIETFYNYEFLFSYSKTTIKDTKGRIVEVIYKDKNPEKYRRIVNDFNDSTNELTISNYDKIGRPLQDKKGLAIHYKRFDSKNEKLIVEERFYDANRKLINSNHNLSTIDCSYSIIRRKVEDDEVITYYLNSEEEQICIESSENPFFIFSFE